MNRKDIARKALEIKAVQIDPTSFFRDFKNNKPIYLNLDFFLHDYNDRSLIIDSLIDIIGENCDGIATISSTGSSIATSLLEHYCCDYIFLIDKNKRFYIETVYNEHELIGKEFILVDNILGRGQAVVRAISALRNKGIKCDKFFCIFNIGYKDTKDIFDGINAFNEYGKKLDPKVEVNSLFNLETVLEVAIENKIINLTQAENIRLWRDKYDKWEKIYGFQKNR